MAMKRLEKVPYFFPYFLFSFFSSFLLFFLLPIFSFLLHCLLFYSIFLHFLFFAHHLSFFFFSIYFFWICFFFIFTIPCHPIFKFQLQLIFPTVLMYHGIVVLDPFFRGTGTSVRIRCGTKKNSVGSTVCNRRSPANGCHTSIHRWKWIGFW